MREVLRAAASLRRWVLHVRPDILHVHHRGLGLAAALARLPVPVVEHVHSTYADRRRTSFRGSARLIAVGSGVADMLVRTYGRHPSSVRLVPNGVADTGVSPWPSQPLHVIAVGRAEVAKGADVLAAAMPALRAAVPGVRLTWVGDGPLRNALSRAGVRADGPSTDVSGLIAGAHVVLLPSRREGLPLSLLEGLSAGRALVATDVGSVGDAVVDGWNGRLLRRSEPEALRQDLVSAIEELARRRGLLERYGERGRRLYERAFTEQRMLEAVDRVYGEVL